MSPGNLRGHWAAVLFAALLAFSWQSLVTQTHVHFETGARGIAASGQANSAAHVDTGKRSSNTPADCPICQEIAHDGLYLLPTLALLEAPRPSPIWRTIATPLLFAVRKPSHAWRSRAPPVQLQA